APPGAADYVGGIRRSFGPVSAARVYRIYHRVPTGYGMEQDTSTYALADLLLDARRGEVAPQLRFDMATAAPADIVHIPPRPPPTKRSVPTPPPAARNPTLACVKRAHGDVAKLGACTQATRR